LKDVIEVVFVEGVEDNIVEKEVPDVRDGALTS
jgi:hypothetical protein